MSEFVPNRKQLRLKNYDYKSSGMYFITICTQYRQSYFGQYDALKHIVNKMWIELPERFPNIRIDEYIVMPNHIHGIIEIVGAGFIPARDDRAAIKAAPTVGQIIGTYKSLCVYQWLKYISLHGIKFYNKLWQRNYYERVIRNDKELIEIRQYIRNNR